MNKLPEILISGIAVVAVVVFCLSSCQNNKIEIASETDFQSLPSLTGKDFSTAYTDSGRVQMILESPLLENYSNVDPEYSEFKEGIHVSFYDGGEEPAATVNAKYAKFLMKTKVWELRDSVVIVNETDDKLETELLFWDQGKDKIYTDRFVKISNADQIVMGTGFESDSRLTKRRIKKISAILYIDEKTNRTDTLQ